MKEKWELFCDDSYYHLFCVRPLGDPTFDSLDSHHFVLMSEAEAFRDAMVKLYNISSHDPHKQNTQNTH